MTAVIERSRVRDYRMDMADLLVKSAESRDAASEAAAQLWRYLAQNDPELLDGWLHELGIQTLTREILNRRGNFRASARRRAGRAISVLSDPASSPQERAAEAARYTMLEMHDKYSGTDKPLGQWTKLETEQASRTHEHHGNTHMLEAAFYRHLADRQGSKTVGEVWSEEQIATLRRTLFDE